MHRDQNKKLFGNAKHFGMTVAKKAYRERAAKNLEGRSSMTQKVFVPPTAQQLPLL